MYVVKYVRDGDHSWVPAPPYRKRTLDLPEYPDSRWQEAERRSNPETWQIYAAVELVCVKADSHGSFNLAMHCCKGQSDSEYYIATALCFNVFTEGYFTLTWEDTRCSPNPQNRLEEQGLPSQPSRGHCVWNSNVYKDAPLFVPDYYSHPGPEISVWKRQVYDLRWQNFEYRCFPAASVDFGEWPTDQRDPDNEHGDSHALYIDDDFAVFCYETGFIALQAVDASQDWFKGSQSSFVGF